MFYYGLLKDLIRFSQTLVYSIIILGIIGIMILILSPTEVFIKIMAFDLPKTLCLIFTLYLLNSTILKIITGVISPQYEISDNTLLIKKEDLKLYQTLNLKK